MNRENIEKKTKAEENPSAILLSPVGAYASQDTRANSVQLAGDNFCPNCNVSFIPRLITQKYCCLKCRKTYWDKLHRDYRRYKAILYRKPISKPKNDQRGKYIRTIDFRNKLSIKNKLQGITPPFQKKYFTNEERLFARREKDRRWKKKHPDKVRLTKKANKAMRKNCGKLSIKTIQNVYEDNIKINGTLTCVYCLKSIGFGKDTLEHKQPLSRGGTNEYSNLAIACLSCNCSKQERTEEEFINQRRGGA